MDRRHFLMSSAAALGASSSVFGSPNDTVRIACVGIGGRGKAHIGGYSNLPNVEIAAICDIDDSHIANGLKQIASLDKPKPQTYKDLRKLLEDKTINIGSYFNKRVLWHELSHFIENDPVAMAASNGFLLSRRESDAPRASSIP